MTTTYERMRECIQWLLDYTGWRLFHDCGNPYPDIVDDSDVYSAKVKPGDEVSELDALKAKAAVADKLYEALVIVGSWDLKPEVCSGSWYSDQDKIKAAITDYRELTK